MLFLVLSALDIVAGAAIYSPAVLGLLAKGVLILAAILFFKGFWSLLSAFGAGYYLEWPGLLDVIAGLALFLMVNDLVSASHILGGLVIGKGVWYLARSWLRF